jgi:hypothetical protein
MVARKIQHRSLTLETQHSTFSVRYFFDISDADSLLIKYIVQYPVAGFINPVDSQTIVGLFNKGYISVI